MNQQHIRQRTLSALLTGVLLLTAVPAFSAHAESAPPDAIGSVTIDDVTTFYYDTRTSGGTTAMWNAAITAPSTATVTLYTDWTAAAGTRLVEEGEGAIFDGVILVPTGQEVTIDLNGFKIDRTLVTGIENGEVLYIQSGGILNLTDTNAGAGHSGALTGGNNLDGAGGIQIEDGGTLNMWGGNISGNYTASSGGGVLMSGSNSLLYMTGGSISGNTAEQNGGGVAIVDSKMSVIKGDVTENQAIGSGGGIYVQGGTVELTAGNINSNTAASGGGICTNTNAVLSFKGETSIQQNRAGSDTSTGAGAGILAMSTEPVVFAGTPNIIRNTLLNGTPSNLTFWIDEEQVYSAMRAENAGLDTTSKIGVNFAGGKARSLIFAPSWSGPECFISDGEDFTLRNDNGNLTLSRVFHFPSAAVIVIIILLLILLIGIILLASFYQNRNKKKKKKRKKSGIKSGTKKSSGKTSGSSQPQKKKKKKKTE